MSFWKKIGLCDRPIVIYPLFFAAFPVLFLYAYNVRQMDFEQALLPLAACMGGASLLWALLTLLLRDARKAGIAGAIFIFFFFTYGRLYQLPESWAPFVPGSAYLLPATLLIWGYCIYFISRAKTDFRKVTMALNIIASVLIFINIVNIGLYTITKPALTRETSAKTDGGDSHLAAATGSLPDIYYIILDEYASPDTMKEWYGYDNSAFLKRLEDKGFFVAHQSRTRSPYTDISISQVLNMEYLTGGYYWDNTKKEFLETASTEYSGYPSESEQVSRKYVYSKVAAFLKEKGYTYVYFGNSATRGSWGGLEDYADLYFNHFETAATPWVSEFQNMLWNTTMVRPFYPHISGNQNTNPYVQQTIGTLEHLKEMPAMKGPKFVFAHIMSPHEPFMFDEKGNYIDFLDKDNYRDKQFYLGQYIFISAEIEKLADALQNKSENRPVIIIQSDHGLRPYHPGISIGGEEWSKILNAIYLPGADNAGLYDSMSPVNTFRLIFNRYFNTDYKMLVDD